MFFEHFENMRSVPPVEIPDPFVEFEIKMLSAPVGHIGPRAVALENTSFQDPPETQISRVIEK